MTLRKLLRIVFGLLVLFAAAVGLISRDHPIILKWVTGSARHFGTSIPATIYTDSQVNDNIRVFYTDESNNYLLSLTNDSLEIVTFSNLNLDEKWIGTPARTSEDGYDFIAGHLFQSKNGGHFLPFQDDIKRSNFDPQFSFIDRQIRFKMPPNTSTFDSVRIKLH
jgi:hypothetical protein